MTTSLSC